MLVGRPGTQQNEVTNDWQHWIPQLAHSLGLSTAGAQHISISLTGANIHVLSSECPLKTLHPTDFNDRRTRVLMRFPLRCDENIWSCISGKVWPYESKRGSSDFRHAASESGAPEWCSCEISFWRVARPSFAQMLERDSSSAFLALLLSWFMLELILW